VNVIGQKRIQALRSAFEAGQSLRGAAASCGVGKGTVERYWRRWKSEDFGGELTISVKGDVKRSFREEADRRDMSVRALLTTIVENIVEDNLFNAVMDP
jgi:transposase